MSYLNYTFPDNALAQRLYISKSLAEEYSWKGSNWWVSWFSDDGIYFEIDIICTNMEWQFPLFLEKPNNYMKKPSKPQLCMS